MLSRKAALLLILAACCTLFGAEVLARPMRAECTGPAAPGEQFLGQVTPAEANTLLKVFGQSKRFLLLDVRTDFAAEKVLRLPTGAALGAPASAAQKRGREPQMPHSRCRQAPVREHPRSRPSGRFPGCTSLSLRVWRLSNGNAQPENV